MPLIGSQAGRGVGTGHEIFGAKAVGLRFYGCERNDGGFKTRFVSPTPQSTPFRELKDQVASKLWSFTQTWPSALGTRRRIKHLERFSLLLLGLII